MPSPATALSILMLAAQPQVVPVAEKATCRVMIDGVCRVETPKAGDGGKGGNAVVNYNFYLGGPTGGAGGNGGGVKMPSTGGPAAVAPAAVPPAPPVSMTISSCKLTIAGKPEVDEKGCQYQKVGKEFTLTAASLNQKYTYTVRVVLNEDTTGTGFLSGGKTAAVRELGTLRRNKACWFNDTVEICAKK